VAALLAVRMLSAGGLWRDEAGAARLATLPTLREVFVLFPHEAFPMLFPVIVRLYSHVIGGGDAALRAFGLVVGLCLVGMLWFNARVTARTVPVLSLALLGLDVPFLVFGESVRGYGLGSCCVLLTYGLLARCLTLPEAGAGRRETLVLGALTALAAVASVQLVLSNLVLVLALCAAAVLVAGARRRFRLAGWFAACGGLAAFSLLPYSSELSAARQQWSIVVTYPVSLHQIWQTFSRTVGPRAVLIVWLLLIVLGLAAVVRGIWRRHRAGAGIEPGPWDAGATVAARAARAGGSSAEEAPDAPRVRGEVAAFAALTVPLALLACGAFLKVLSYIPRPWYFLALIALLASALETIFASPRRWRGHRLAWVRWAVAALVAAMQLLPLSQQLTIRQTNADLVARQVAASAAPQDLVLINPWYYDVSFSRYYAGPARVLTVPNLPDHRIHRYDLLKARLASRGPIDDVLAAAAATLRGGHRVWLVGGATWPKPGEAVIVLPPAPASATGWHDRPYVSAWSLQLGAFVQHHALRAVRVTVPHAEPASQFEDLPLVVVSGWREGST
jgi:hypothetical protein